ncbi:cobalamin B12-binding domain-containing protein [Clostridium grantii]|uniref:Methanogenic corrinoid protein MtbC1 n=1 Tax=Clostridium grantii DSM 8605 TaxID=1121316 RepID=A0A1M5VSU4_9CLOT|nr:cobalamin-dependent protein [Clostridium grantii]SHH78322.1 Methanogenic corrinoid protein MtbC1 [Clostridium grantii DSM 8605]
MDNQWGKIYGKTVSYSSATNYKENLDVMTKKVNDIMEEKLLKENLIGDNPLTVMFNNHENHGKFMTNVFLLNDYELLEKSLNWVFSSYIARGFSENYFKEVLSTWIQVINLTLDIFAAREITEVYYWMENFYDEFDVNPIEEKKLSIKESPFEVVLKDKKNMLFSYLIEGDYKSSLELVKEIIHDKESLSNIYTKIIKEAMYDVGKAWEMGEISISQEHLATSVISRIMANIYMDYFILTEITKGKIIVTTATNEYHELGIRIVADLLELDGWDVIYLGSNIPKEDLVKTILKERPSFLVISVTMAFNISKAKEIIDEIKGNDDLRKLKILAGGQAFNYFDNKSKIGADKISLSVSETLDTAREWWKEANGEGEEL